MKPGPSEKPRRVLIHGIHVESELELGEDATDGSAELWLERAISPSSAPASATIVAERNSAGANYTLLESGSTAWMQFHGVCDFEIDRGARRVKAHSVDDATAEMLALFFKGSVLAATLVLDGHLVLHASAVVTPGGTVAFAGSSGAGKSTLAALACCLGYPLMTDDVLRVSLEQVPRAFRGTTSLRLRPGSESIASRITDARTYRDADGRLCLRPPASAPPDASLSRVVLPRVTDTATIAMRELKGAEAVQALLGSVRIAGWTDPRILAAQLRLASALARVTRVVAADVPTTLLLDHTQIQKLLDPV
jgi:hypothetical protein